MKKNKYRYLWVIQGYYNGWEDMAEYDKSESTYAEVRHDLKEYRNDGYGAPYRLISRRVLNEE
jgi:hypothetical protein